MSTETKRNKTKICCLDLDKELIEYLKARFEVYNGSLGRPVQVAGFNKFGLNLLLNYVLPDNLQEYEVFIEDMVKKESIQYKKEDNTHTNISGQEAYYFNSNPPQTEFNPCPYGSKVLQIRIKNQRVRPAIKIAFQEQFIDADYVISKISTNYNYTNESANNYMHLLNICSSQITGTEVKLCENELSRAIFEPFLDDIIYNEVYAHPMTRIDGNSVEKDKHLIPLLMTRTDGIISYMWCSENDVTIILPQTKKKKELLDKVFEEILFKYFSKYFPEIEESVWIKNSSYYLPNYDTLLDEKDALEKKYKEDLNAIEQRMELNNKQYSFLHDLLTATGDELVVAMIKYFRWLNFTNVVDKDKNLDKEFNEEDIQIDTDEQGLLVVEVKGICGTSTDAQCNQILKVVNRRREERQSFKVYGLYIVNNQRNVAPENRVIPPFNGQQIKDAEYDKRGLCYTWQLFNLFFEIEDGIISKEEARKVLFNSGLIDFTPSVTEVGTPHKYYKQNTIACIRIEDIPIKVGDYFLFRKNNRWMKTRIITIKDEDRSVQCVRTGSFGFGLEKKIPNNVKLYI